MGFKDISLQGWFDLVGQETDPRIKEEKRFFLLAKTAMGDGGEEEQLLRLMVWVSTRLQSTATHSRIYRPMDILREGTAWCDQHVKVFLFFAWHLLDLPGREIAVIHSDGKNGHTVCEVFYDGGWHFFDVHSDHQAVYRGRLTDFGDDDGLEFDAAAPDIMSYEDIKRIPEVVEREQHWWKGQNGEGKVGFYRGGRLNIMHAPFHEYNESRLTWAIP